LIAAQKKKVFAEPDAATATWQMLLAVNYLHHEGITHRDLKLENFLYDEEGSDFLKLIDFGLSRFSKEKNMHDAVGTLTYAAPEVLECDYSHGSCDLWSLGCITFILLFGYMPFAAKDDKALVRQIACGAYKAKHDKWKRVSKAAQDFVKQLLVVDPSQRMTARQALAHPFITEHNLTRRMSSARLDPRVGLGFLSLARANEFRKACVLLMAWSWTLAHGPSAMRKLRSLYINMGSTKNGIVLVRQLEHCFSMARVPTEEIRSAMVGLRSLDCDGDDELHYSDFLAGMLMKMLEKDHECCNELLKEAFRRFEDQGQGFITRDSVKMLAGDIPEEDLADAFSQKDLHHKGQMNIDEFMSYVKADSFSAISPAGAPLSSSRRRWQSLRNFVNSCSSCR